MKVQKANDGGANVYVNDANGQILRRAYDYNGSKSSFIYTMIGNGELIGTSDTAGAGFATTYESANAATITAAPSIYSGQNQGETLSGIARAVWGDARLWYLIADANGMSESPELKVGDIVKIPTRINTVHNDANTFRPYNPSDIVGSTTPELPPPVPHQPCGGHGTMLVAIVAIIVTVVVSYYAGHAAGKEAGAIIGSLAGNAAGQAVGNAIGVQQGFDMNSFALAGISAGISATLPAASWFAEGTMGIAYRAAISNALSQGIAMAMDMQKGFDWRSTVASGLGAAAGQYAGAELGVNGEAPPRFDMTDFSNRLLKSVVAAGTTAIAKGGRISVVQVGVDAFGNALGESIAGALKPEQNRLSGFKFDNYGQSPRDSNAPAWSLGSGGGLNLSYRDYDKLPVDLVDSGLQSNSGPGQQLPESMLPYAPYGTHDKIVPDARPSRDRRVSLWLNDPRAPKNNAYAEALILREEARVEQLGVGIGTVVPRGILTSLLRASNYPDNALNSFLDGMDGISTSIAAGGFYSIGDRPVPKSHEGRFFALQPLSQSAMGKVQAAAMQLSSTYQTYLTPTIQTTTGVGLIDDAAFSQSKDFKETLSTLGSLSKNQLAWAVAGITNTAVKSDEYKNFKSKAAINAM